MPLSLLKPNKIKIFDLNFNLNYYYFLISILMHIYSQPKILINEILSLLLFIC